MIHTLPEHLFGKAVIRKYLKSDNHESRSVQKIMRIQATSNFPHGKVVGAKLGGLSILNSNSDNHSVQLWCTEQRPRMHNASNIRDGQATRQEERIRFHFCQPRTEIKAVVGIVHQNCTVQDK